MQQNGKNIDNLTVLERFEGLSELRGDCADIKSLIPTTSLDDSESGSSCNPDDTASLEANMADLDIQTSDNMADLSLNAHEMLHSNASSISSVKDSDINDNISEGAAGVVSQDTNAVVGIAGDHVVGDVGVVPHNNGSASANGVTFDESADVTLD